MPKKTLVILPGWGGNKETWKEFASLASDDFEVQIIDLPCFGEEPCPETVWGVEDYVEFVKRHLERSGAESKDPKKVGDSSPLVQNDKIVLLGHSFGGQIATIFAAKYPEMIEKLVLTAPAVFRPRKSFKRLIFIVGAKFGKLIFKIPWIEKGSLWAERVYHQAIGAVDYHDTSGIKREIFKKVIRQDQGEAASKIKIPTLIFWGTRDGYLPISDAHKLNKLILNSRLEIIKNGRHGLHLQMPEKLYKIIYDFLV